MQPSEQTPALHPEAPTTSPTTPPKVERTDSAHRDSGEVTAEFSPSLGDRFRSEVLALLSAIRTVDSSDSDSPRIRELQAVLANPEVRAVAWEHIGAHGVPCNLSLQQRRILAATLMPYIETDKEQSWNAFSRMTTLAASSTDMTTYELAGRTALRAGLPDFMVELLAQPFAEYATHNAARVPALAPWMKLFIERGSEEACGILLNALARRLEAAEFSSYDHILNVLCQSRQPLALYAIQNFATPPIFDDKAINPPMVFLLGLGVVDAARVLPCAAIAAYLLGGFETLTSQFTPLSALAFGFAYTWIVRRPALQELAREHVAQTQALAKSPHYRHFVNQVFEKLSALPSDRQDAARVLDVMEAHPAFEDVRAEWREFRSRHALQA